MAGAGRDPWTAPPPFIESKGSLAMTRAKLTALVGGLLAVVMTAVPVRAAEEAKEAAKEEPGRAYVVVVGIGDYADKQIKPRPHAEADAKALYDLFTNSAYLGADADHARLLLGGKDEKRNAEPATKA